MLIKRHNVRHRGKQRLHRRTGLSPYDAQQTIFKNDANEFTNPQIVMQMLNRTILATPAAALGAVPVLEHDVQHLAARRHVAERPPNRRQPSSDRPIAKNNNVFQKRARRSKFVIDRRAFVREGEAVRHAAVAHDERLLRRAAQRRLSLLARHPALFIDRRRARIVRELSQLRARNDLARF
jgi:hypothetical protein